MDSQWVDVIVHREATRISKANLEAPQVGKFPNLADRAHSTFLIGSK
jgi:hypothetical protein